MKTMIDAILYADFSLATIFGQTILHSIWQITLIALILRLLLFLTSKNAANVRYWLSLGAMILAVIWSIHTFSSKWEQYHLEANSIQHSASAEVASTFVPTMEFNQLFIGSFEENTRLLSQFMEPIMPYLAIFWLFGMCFFASRIIVGLFDLRLFSKKSTHDFPNHWQSRFEVLKQLSGIGRKVEVRLSELVPVPITYRFFRPIILLPISVFTGLTDDQIEVLLLHELAHIRRHDYVINLLQSIIEVLFFYHPFIWWISKNVRAEREHCCDDEVMNLRHQPMLYAQTLTQIQSQHFSLKTNLAMSVNGNKGVFTQRIYRLFNHQEPHSKMRNAVTALLLLFFSGLTMAFYPNPNQSSQNIEVEITKIEKDTVPSKTLTVKKAEPAKVKMEEVTETIQSTKIDENTTVIEVTRVLQEKKESDSTMKNEILNKEGEIIEVAPIETEKEDKAKAKVSPEKKSLIVETLEGKKPTVILDGKQISDSKIDDEGRLIMDIPAEKIQSVNVYKGEKAKEKFGIDNPDGIVEIILKEDKTDKFATISKNKGDQKVVIQVDEKPNSQQPLFVIDGKKMTSNKIEKEISPDDILAITVIKGEASIEKYGQEGVNGVVEIITKAKGKKDKKKIKKEEKKKSKIDKKTKEKKILNRASMESNRQENSTAETTELSLSVYPNPTDGIVNIQLIIKEKGHAKVTIFNRWGEVMKKVVDQELEVGKHQFKWDAEGQESATYFIHFGLNGKTINQQFFVKEK